MPEAPSRLKLARGPKRLANPHRQTTTARLYGWRWQKLRDAWLKAAPRVCVECEKRGFLVPAEHVDHIKPHRGDLTLAYDWNNLQGLCASDNAKKRWEDQRAETAGSEAGRPGGARFEVLGSGDVQHAPDSSGCRYGGPEDGVQVAGPF